ncbi:hypothetical protein GCM10011490_13550 [Pseudoclavibacter endophyticus]|uniref:ABC transporter permease n=1 Tax=Pseudoclavibacter endophyticus TaxID=1778590 RepID=A0A6H9WJ23_9MICO|nr:ABC transporter permease [Pseudoclavibacter endophyticus]KAB1649243.1 ABC transporter permease [Pseudoclavibacter endophyticus]GGA64193.1 hypothetical protein GCM10011490_13550 [Pseudoclavibacter endophyticus]
MWTLIRRSARVNRSAVAGAAIALTAAIGMLTAAAFWLDAGLRDPALSATAGELVTVASSFIGVASLIAGLTVASTIATGLRERRPQFALLAAVGATSSRLRRMVVAETLSLFVVAAPVGALIGFALGAATVPLLQDAGLAPGGYGLPLTVVPVIGVVAVTIAVALISAWTASRRTFRVNAAEALRTSGVEPARVGAGRRATAVVVAALGVVAAGMPLVLPGMLGVAFGTMSTFLLMTAIALIGPIAVAWAAGRAQRLLPARSSSRLAVANIRGFSHRLTAVIVPFALVAALGAVQLSTNAIVAAAARDQLASGILTDLVGPADGDFAAIEGLDGVNAVTVLASQSMEVLADQDDDLPFEVWEPGTAGTLTTTGNIDAAVDPDVTAGSLGELAAAGTIAVSADALIGSTTGVGDTLTVRIGGVTQARTIVAIYAASLGFGDYLLVTADTAPGGGTMLVDTDDGRADAVRDHAAALGIPLQPPDVYAAGAPAGGESTTSSVLLFSLLLFALLGAINTLITLIRGRREELVLLIRIGATRPTLVRTVVTESLIATVLAVAAGTVAAIPAAVTAGFSLLSGWPDLPWIALTALPVALLVCALLTALITSILVVSGGAPRPASANLRVE